MECTGPIKGQISHIAAAVWPVSAIHVNLSTCFDDKDWRW